VVTLIPLAMLLSFVAGISGMLLPVHAGWLALPAKLLLAYMLDVAETLSRVPHTFLQNLTCSVGTLGALYGALLIVTAFLWFKKPPKNVTVTDNNTLN
jgi:hypothetical protein